MTVHLHRAARADQLAQGLAELLSEPLADPFAAELVLVPAKGVERWLSQRLAHVLGAGLSAADGVCAGVDFRSPASLINEVTDRPERDAWSPQALVWPILSCIDESHADPWCGVLARHLGYFDMAGDEQRRGRRYSVARRIAGLFASYVKQRPTMMEEWCAGPQGYGPGGSARDGDGLGGQLSEDLQWQPELWRRLLDRLDLESPLARQRRVIDQLVADPEASALPPRLSLFGHTRIPAADLDLLRALAVHREVHLWLPHPSPQLWRDLQGQVGGDRRPLARGEGDNHLAAGHPLLRTLGRDLREFQLSLGQVDDQEVARDDFAPGLLGQLQHDIYDNTQPTLLASATGAETKDRSIRIHACHGAARQVEVLREELLGLLSADPSLEPRDILVMCPDIETYAPLITAAFGLANVQGPDESAEASTGAGELDAHPGHELRVLLADRSPVQTNELLSVVSQVLDIAAGRAEASRVVDLMSMPAVRRRFGFTDDHLETIATWVGESGVRWAFDADHRAQFGLDGMVHNTWRFGLDRILAGVAVSDDAHTWFGKTLPLDQVSSSDIETAGRLAEFIDRLRAFTDLVGGDHSLAHWVVQLGRATESLTRVERGEEWQLGQFYRELGDIDADSGGDVRLRLSDIRSLVAERLAGRPSRTNFRSGSLTVCTMTPMRSVPHRVICMVGLDDGAFPRVTADDGDDVLLRTPMVGEREVRSEDRQLLLDAITSATQHLVVTFSGANEVTGKEKPPSVPLQELLDCLTQMAPHTQAVSRQALQAVAPQNFSAAPRAEALSFDKRAYAAVRSAAQPRHEPDTLQSLSLTPENEQSVSLADLVDFFKSPAKAFLRSGIQVALPEDTDLVADAIPIELNGLDEWKIGNEAVDQMLAGMSLQSIQDRVWRQGVLPPGKLGWSKLQRILKQAEPIALFVDRTRAGHKGLVIDVDVDIDGTRLIGSIADVYGANRIVKTYSRLGPKQWLEVWIPHLALALLPGAGTVSGAVGRGKKSNEPVGRVTWTPVQPDTAQEHLRELISIYRTGMTRPIFLPLKSSYAYARHHNSTDWRVKRARDEWSGSEFAENLDPEHVLIWGAGSRYDDLVHDDYDTWAQTLWQPMLNTVVRS